MTHEWLEFWLLLQEAEQLIQQRRLPLDPDLVVWRDRNWEMLNPAPEELDREEEEAAVFEVPRGESMNLL